MRSRCCVQALSCVPASGLSRPAVINSVVCWSSFSAGSSNFVQSSATMKRRNVIDGKSRRPVSRKNKISENFYGSTLVYVKLLLLWALVLLADHFLEFRFEYLWPFWLFLRSVYDSFKYQGLAFSVFFICIALTSDMICFLFIPVHWLFFAASTYVWVQYVWHTEKGICLPTVFLWLLFVYIEASIRLKEFKAHIDMRHLPFHLDLCRPFAAHCIGYPVVTLGFGFKTYVGYRMRQRRQKEVQKVNEYYYDFLREGLPPGPIREEAFNPHPSPNPCVEERISDGAAVISHTSVGVSGSGGGSGGVNLPGFSGSSSPSTLGALLNTSTSSSASSLILPWNGHTSNTNHHNTGPSSSDAATLVALAVSNSTNSFGSGNSPGSGKGGASIKHGHNSRGENCTHTNGEHHDTTCLQANSGESSSSNLRHRGSKGSSQVILNGISNSGVTNHGGSSTSNGTASQGTTLGEVDYMEKMKEEAGGHHLEGHHSSKSSNGVLPGSNNVSTPNSAGNISIGGSNKSNKPSSGGGSGSTPRDASRKNRGDASMSGKQGSTKDNDPTAKMEADLKKLKVDLQISRNKENELRDQIISYMSSERTLKSEISNLQVEKSVLETRISSLLSTRAGEKATLSTLEKKFADERKQKTEFQIKLETERKTKKEAASAERAAQQTQTRSEVSKLDAEIKTLRAELQSSRERCQMAEQDAYMLRNRVEQCGDPEVLQARLDHVKEKNRQIENSLSSETKLKMDLFSALGEAKREISIKTYDLQSKDHEISTLRQKIAEILAVMPQGNSSSGMNASKDDQNISSGHRSNGNLNGGGLASFTSSFTTPTTLALDLPQDTDLSSFTTGSNKLSALGLANLEDKLLTSSDTSSCLSGTNSLYTTAFSRTNGNTDH